MNRYAVQLISRGAINKIGNMLYDYGNSVWLASMGTIGQTVLGMYQISELVTSILINPFGGVISDRFSRRKILMTTDLVCGILCLAISFIRNDSWMIGALIFANIVQAVAFAFSRTTNKAIITEVVEKDEIVIYNSRLELVLQVVGVSSPVLSFLVLQFASLHMTLLLDASKRRTKDSRAEEFHRERYFCGYQRWLALYQASKRNFLSLVSGFQCEFLFCGL